MKRTAFLVLATLLTALASHAQLLWKISGNGLERPSYLFGTHHLAPVSVLDSVPGFADALASVDKVYGEIIMAERDSPEVVIATYNAIKAPADSTLSAVLTPAQLDSVNTLVQRYAGPEASEMIFDDFKPSVVSLQLNALQMRQVFPDFNAAEQIDAEVQRRAEAAGKEIGGLDTIELQTALLFGGSIAEQAEELMDIVRLDSQAAELARRMWQLYLKGDLDGLLAMMDEEQKASGYDIDRLINIRNSDWMRILVGLLPTTTVLVAVGAGHLPGEKGLISLLRGKGYDVTPVEK